MSMASRLFGLALGEGADPSDPAALSDFVERFNAMPEEWRRRLADGPGLPEGPSVAQLNFEAATSHHHLRRGRLHVIDCPAPHTRRQHPPASCARFWSARD